MERKMTKLEIRHHYLNNLEEIYAGRVDYSSGSRAREMAIRAADAALAGQIKLEGEAWFKALAKAGLPKSATKAQIAALPE
jgi:hypothetical protein